MAKQPITVTSYTHRDRVRGWSSDEAFREYMTVRNAAVRTAGRADRLYSGYLDGRFDDAGDAAAVQAAFWLDRLAWNLTRDMCLLWFADDGPG